MTSSIQNDVWNKLGALSKLERDRALYNLKRYIAASKRRETVEVPTLSSSSSNTAASTSDQVMGQAPPEFQTKAPFHHVQPTPEEVLKRKKLNSEELKLGPLDTIADNLMEKLLATNVGWEEREAVFRALALLLQECEQFGQSVAAVSDDDVERRRSNQSFVVALANLSTWAVTSATEFRVRQAASLTLSAICGRGAAAARSDTLTLTLAAAESFLASPSAKLFSDAADPAAADAAAAAAAAETSSMFELTAPFILRSIERDRVKEAAETAAAAASGGDDGDQEKRERGWRTIETSMRAVSLCLSAWSSSRPLAVDQSSPVVSVVLSDPLRHALSHCFLSLRTHSNRYVREACFVLLTAIFNTGHQQHQQQQQRQQGADDNLTAEELALAEGLADNWSQVRFAATQACSALFFPSCTLSLSAANQSLLRTETLDQAAKQQQQQQQQREEDHASLTDKRIELLLPPLCLNRYYVAEGVRVLTMSVWKKLFPQSGRQLIAEHTEPFVQFYCRMSQAENHAVREAAAHCIAELAHKVEPAAVRPHTAVLLQALLDLFKDESWPVRDCASLATGQFCASFPAQCLPHFPELQRLWFAHCHDNIWSVRENSAIAIGQVLTSLLRVTGADDKGQPDGVPDGRAFMHQCVANVDQWLGAAKLQRSTKEGKRERDNDLHRHTEQTQFSCGSLAPKLKRGVGCMDHGFSRPTEEWEKSDGAIYLMREILRIQPECEKLNSWLKTLSELLLLRQFYQYPTFIDTICKQLIQIIKIVGNHRVFEKGAGGTDPLIKLFIEPLFETTKDEARLASKSAEFCLLDLRDQYGDHDKFYALLTPDQRDFLIDAE